MRRHHRASLTALNFVRHSLSSLAASDGGQRPCVGDPREPYRSNRTAAQTEALRCCVVEAFLFSCSFFVFLPALFFYACSCVEWQSVGSRAQRSPLCYWPGCVAM